MTLRKKLDPFLVLGGTLCAIVGFCILVVDVAVPASVAFWNTHGPAIAATLGNPPMSIVGVVLFAVGLVMLALAE